MRDALAAAGYAPATAAGPGEVARLVAARQPALAVLDLVLPGADGIELMHTLPALAGLPVIFVSAYGRGRGPSRGRWRAGGGSARSRSCAARGRIVFVGWPEWTHCCASSRKHLSLRKARSMHGSSHDAWMSDAPLAHRTARRGPEYVLSNPKSPSRSRVAPRSSDSTSSRASRCFRALFQSPSPLAIESAL